MSAAAGFALLFTLWLPAAAEIYKCTDGAGGVRYSDRPCTGPTSVIIPQAATPGVDAHASERRERANKLLRAFSEERAEEQRAQAEARAQRQQRSESCSRAQDRLARMNTAGRLYRIAQDGSQVDLSADERATAVAKAQAEVSRWCD